MTVREPRSADPFTGFPQPPIPWSLKCRFPAWIRWSGLHKEALELAQVVEQPLRDRAVGLSFSSRRAGDEFA
jgi:hypothetical protein